MDRPVSILPIEPRRAPHDDCDTEGSECKSVIPARAKTFIIRIAGFTCIKEFFER
jgi:hypothetical protein